MHGIIPMGDDRDMQATADKAIDLSPPLSVILPRVVNDDGCLPVDVRHKLKRQVARGDIPDVFGRVECQPQLNYRYSKNEGVSSAFSLPAIP